MPIEADPSPGNVSESPTPTVPQAARLPMTSSDKVRIRGPYHHAYGSSQAALACLATSTTSFAWPTKDMTIA